MKTSMLILCVLGMIAANACAFTGPEAPLHGGGQDVIVYAKAHRMQRILLKLPQSYDPTKSYTLLLGLHGNGGNAEGLSSAFARYAKEQILVAFLDGQYPRLSGGYSWYYETGNKNLWEKFDTLSISNLLETINAISKQYSIGNVFVFGFSQGASLAYMTGLRNPGLIRGVAAIAGSMPEIDNEGAVVHSGDITNARRVKMFIARGRSDNQVGKNHFNAQKEFFTKQGYDVTTLEFDAGHGLTDELMERVLEWIKEKQ
ncbi:MAG: alpha/beta hydrolase-fold protein [bacterium]